MFVAYRYYAMGTSLQQDTKYFHQSTSAVTRCQKANSPWSYPS